MNIAVYSRYSSHNQTECSIDGQLKECYAYAKANKYNIVAEYVDRAKSGTKDNREQFLKMIDDSSKNLFDNILVYQLDRFARNRYDSAIYKKKLQKHGIRVLSARENITDDASGILMESVLEGMAEYYSVELGQKVKRGMGINADNYYYNGGTIPLGFKTELIKQTEQVSGMKPVVKKKYVVDEETAFIIRKIFEMYANGMIMADIIKYMNNQHLKTAYGKQFNKNSIRGILINKKYIGVYTYNGKETENVIPRIVSNDLFYKVQEMMFKNKKAPARARAMTDYLLTTKLFCGHCKDMMVGISGTSQTGKLHNYYICKQARIKKCNKKTVKKGYIEDIVVRTAKETLTDECVDYIAKTVFELSEKEKYTANLKRLNRLISENEKQRNNLFSSLKICEIESVRKSIFEEIAKMEQEHKQLERDIILEENQHLNLSMREIKYYLSNMRNGNVNDERYRQMIINLLVNSVYLYDEKLLIVFNVKNKTAEIELDLLKDIESSYMGVDALP